MPRMNVTAGFTTGEVAKIDKARRIKGQTRYKFLQQATLERAEAILNGEKNVGRKEDDSGTESRGQGTLKVSY